MKSHLRAVIFDLDNTCVETETPWFVAWREIFANHGHELDHSTWRGLMTNDIHPAQHLFAHHRVRTNRNFVENVRDRVMHDIRSRGLMPGVQELIDDCKTEGLVLAIATNGSRRWVSEVMSDQTKDLFDCFVTMDCVGAGNGKPKPLIHGTALDRLGVEPRQAVGIEDSQRGLDALKSVGVPALVVPSKTDPFVATRGVATADSLIGMTAAHLHQVNAHQVFKHQTNSGVSALAGRSAELVQS